MGVGFFFQFLLSWTRKCRSAHLAPPLCIWHTSDHATDSHLRRQLWSSSPSSSSPKKQTKKKNSLNGGLVKMESWDGEWARSGAEIALMKSLAKIQPAARGRGAFHFEDVSVPIGTMSFRPWWPRTHWIVKVPPPSSSLLLPRAECNITNLTWTQTERNLLPFVPACPSVFFCIYFFF